VNDVELFLGKYAARNFGLIGADRHVEPRAVQTGNGLRDAGQQFEFAGRLDVGGAVHNHHAVAIEQIQRHHRLPGRIGDAASSCRACRATCGTTNQKATSTTKTPPATARLGNSVPTTSHTSR
jgi:hypothetical protein